MCGADRLDGDVLDLRMVVEEGADETAVERSAEQGGGGGMDAKEAASLFDVTRKVAQSLIIEYSSGARRVLVGGADKADGIELSQIGVVVEQGFVFGVDGGPAKTGDGGVDGGSGKREGAIAERGDDLDGGGD